jgi:hypothetical protein
MMRAMKKRTKAAKTPARTAAKKASASTKKAVAPAKKTRSPASKPAAAAKKAPRSRPMNPRRADFGAPIEGFFAKQPAALRPILEELRGLVEEAAPGASAALKWGMPFYTLGGKPLCALAGFKSHVNLILAGPPGTFADPDDLLEGDGKTGKHLKLRTLTELPRAAIRRWLKSAVKLAKA